MALNCAELPTWINSAVIPHLTNLYVTVLSLKTQHVETLGKFPKLLALDLTHYGDDCPLVVISGDAFPELTCLETTIALRFEPRAMPNLEHLEFSVSVKSLQDAHFDFDFRSLGNLPMLGNIRVEIRCHGARYRDFEKAEESLSHMVRIHPNRPILDIVEEEVDGMLYYDSELDDDDEVDEDIHDSDQTGEEVHGAAAHHIRITVYKR
ncbi:uncharacterized protein LOC119310777 [Triticum dicoccoides]|uniref:uncharacterized protein LOC119310777 n=1 Tax=Triticum dicoccoides TaxID=85692 RepID=UPI001890D446|nr:uncharacterized protein LOC119310777 [Triticum dicoccoides]